MGPVDWKAVAAELAVALRNSTPNAGFRDLAIGAMTAYVKAWKAEER